MTTVPKLWPGATVVCIASGPSLTQEDVDSVRGKARVIAINENFKIAPWADCLYCADNKWLRWKYEEKHPAFLNFAGLKYTVAADAAKYRGWKILQHNGKSGLELLPTHLRTGRNSGYQAINLAVHLGAARILLLGYDMQPGPKGELHWHPDHPDRLRSPFDAFLICFETLRAPLNALKIDVINCSRRTKLQCFPRSTIQEALPAVSSMQVQDIESCAIQMS